MKVEIDVTKCIGSGSCEMLAPEVFSVGDEGIVSLIDANPGDDLYEKVRKAATACPTGVITIVS
ncbi:MAG TPA: ferredoxin [Acidimicrobiales bacterium]|nr:ferredoxin [Acidimicrobiales bacterium]